MTPILHALARGICIYILAAQSIRFFSSLDHLERTCVRACVCERVCVEGRGRGVLKQMLRSDGHRGRMDQPIRPLAGYWSPTKPSAGRETVEGWKEGGESHLPPSLLPLQRAQLKAAL